MADPSHAQPRDRRGSDRERRHPRDPFARPAAGVSPRTAFDAGRRHRRAPGHPPAAPVGAEPAARDDRALPVPAAARSRARRDALPAWLGLRASRRRRAERTTGSVAARSSESGSRRFRSLNDAVVHGGYGLYAHRTRVGPAPGLARRGLIGGRSVVPVTAPGMKLRPGIP